MKLMYSRPILRDLSQGSRIAFVRQLRLKSQDEVAKELGIDSYTRRRTVTRYEKGDRNPLEKRTRKIAEILDVNYQAIKVYDYKEPLDFIFTLLWLEELLPNYHIDLSDVKVMDDEFLKIVETFLKEWEKVKLKRKNNQMKYAEYIEWKLNYSLGGESNE